MNEQKKLFRLIQNCSFMIQETALYLDTHPNCRQALRHMEKYQRILREAEAEYEDKYGQLSINTGACGNGWRWVKEPWPWQV